MSKLHISDELSLPIDAATQTFAFIARKGAGKTYAAGKLVELLLDADVQVVVIDTVGNWYGLRIAADGKAKGYDVPVFGGLRKDLPLEAAGGDLVADVVVDTGRSFIIDVSQFSLGDRKRFATAFGERLWLRKKAESHPSPLMLVIEESQLIVPEQASSDSARMVGIYEEIIRLGRNYGIGCTMITQRPQSVNKEVLNQTECLFVGQINGSQERLALKKWITHQGMDVHLVDELPSLPIGTMYVWSPQWLQILKKVHVAAKKTFDASATPKVGQRQVRRDPAPLDVNDLEQRMAQVVERAKDNDPKALKNERDKLRLQIQKLQAQKPITETKTIEKPVVTDKQVKAIETVVTRLEREGERRIEAANVLRESGEQLKTTARDFAAALRSASAPVAPQRLPVQMRTVPTVARAPMAQRVSRVTGDAGEVGTGGLRRILIALAQRPGLTNRQIGVRAGLSSTSGSFGTYMSRARSSGWMRDEGERRFITEEGIAALGDFEPLPTGQDLLNFWLADLGNSGSARILRALADAYPEAMTNEQLGEAAQMSHNSGSFGTYMSRLRTLELIQSAGRGMSKASDELFEGAMV